MSLLRTRAFNRLLRLRPGLGDLPPAATANLHALEGLDPARPARDHDFSVVDLETTGLDTERDRVVSVGAVRVRGGMVRLADHFSELVNPGRDIPPQAVTIHGIKPDQVAGARRASEVFVDFLAWLGGDVLVAHYALFDLYFINLTMRRLYGFPLQNLVVDVRTMCKGVILPSDPYGIGRHDTDCGLDALAQRFSIETAERHTALGDALLTAQVFQCLLARMESRGRGRLRDVIRISAPA